MSKACLEVLQLLELGEAWAEAKAELPYQRWAVTLTGDWESGWEAGAKVTIDLSDGENPLGILEQGHRQGWKVWENVDFVRLTVILGPVASASAASAAAGGHWVLTSTTPAVGPGASPWSAGGSKMTMESSNGRIAWSYSFDGSFDGHPEYQQADDGSVSWGPPPASAAPGDT